jgi:hypothetical protein
MKKTCWFLFFVFVLSTAAKAQDYKFARIDKSPADIVYYPLNIVKEKDLSKKPLIRIIYSRPAKNGRPIFGVLEQFGKVWRTGANETTEIRFYEDVKVGNQKVKAGTYSIFTIPEKDKWTFILNKQTDKWGSYTYDQSKDVLRLDVPVKKSEEVIEHFSITFKDLPQGAAIVMGWDNTVVEVPVHLKEMKFTATK